MVNAEGVVVISGVTITKVPSLLVVRSAAHEVSGVLDAAGYEPLISPGSVVAVFGSFVEETVEAGSVSLPMNLDGFSVTFDGKEAGLFGAFAGSFDQANVQAPWDLDVSSGSVDAALASPGIFTFDYGPGRAIVQNLDGSFAQVEGTLGETPAKPAAAGRVITIWAHGLGPVPDPPGTGDAPGFDGEGNAILPVPDKMVWACIR